MSRSDLEMSGGLFEVSISGYLSRKYPGARVLQNLELYSHQLGKDTQVDIVLVHQKGIFVIEAKNWSSWIRGSYNDFRWTGKSRKKDLLRVFSPVNQNAIHIRALRNGMRVKGIAVPVFHNIVCFPDGTALYTNCEEVCNFSYLSYLIDGKIEQSTLNIDVNRYAVLLESLK